MTCPSQPRQKLRPCGGAEATGPANGQTVFFPLFSAPGSASGSRTPAAAAGPAAPSAVPPSGLSSVVPGEKAGCRRARTPSEAHMVLYRERMRRSWALMSTPSSSGRGFLRGKRSIRLRSADAWCAPRLHRGRWKKREITKGKKTRISYGGLSIKY